ncbi:MAG: hypothetical protein MI861_24580, partial [Pirellulales bacterium]|nr:hypothetical protein [Pirellulales bacterium]
MNPNIRFSSRPAIAGWMALVLVLAPFSGLPKSGADEVSLADRQASLANRYQRLEELLLRLAEVEAAENPERSALLRRAARQSRDKFVLDKMRLASSALKTKEFQNAVDSQTTATEELSALLKLLLSEDRSKRIRDEKERLAKLAKEIKRTIRAQQSTRARNENGADLEEVKDEQESIGDRAEKLADSLSDQEQEKENQTQASNSGNQDSQSQPPESTPSDPPSPKPNSDEQPNPEQRANPEQRDPKSTDDNQPSPQQEKPTPGDPSQSDESNSEAQPNDSQSPQNQSPQNSPSQSQQSQSQQSQQPQTPEQQVEQALRQAIEKMRQAEQDLENAKRADAADQQRAAEDDLRAAIDRLEQILRQLREEEMQRELAKLEARLRKMAAMQSKVLDDTIALAATPTSQRNRQTDLKAGDLAFEEK